MQPTVGLITRFHPSWKAVPVLVRCWRRVFPAAPEAALPLLAIRPAYLPELWLNSSSLPAAPTHLQAATYRKNPFHPSATLFSEFQFPPLATDLLRTRLIQT